MTDATDARLAAQYEAYPYPARDPAEEARRLVVGSPSHLREIDHWVFGGRSTTSIAAACCTICQTRRQACARCSRCWRQGAGLG